MPLVDHIRNDALRLMNRVGTRGKINKQIFGNMDIIAKITNVKANVITFKSHTALQGGGGGGGGLFWLLQTQYYVTYPQAQTKTCFAETQTDVCNVSLMHWN